MSEIELELNGYKKIKEIGIYSLSMSQLGAIIEWQKNPKEKDLVPILEGLEQEKKPKRKTNGKVKSLGTWPGYGYPRKH